MDFCLLKNKSDIFLHFDAIARVFLLLAFLLFSFPWRDFCKKRITTKNLIQFYITALFIYKYHNFNYYLISFYITKNLFHFKILFLTMGCLYVYLKKNYAIILLKQWPGAKWIFDLNNKALLREFIFYSDYKIIVCNAAICLI